MSIDPLRIRKHTYWPYLSSAFFSGSKIHGFLGQKPHILTIFEKSWEKNVLKIEKISPGCDFEQKRAKRVEPGWWTFGRQGPQGAAPSTRTRLKKEGGSRKKEEARKKEMVRGKGYKRDLNTQAARALANFSLHTRIFAYTRSQHVRSIFTINN